MKNKYYLYSILAAALALNSCDYNEDHFPGFDELAHPTHIWNDTIRLADTDYKTIADNSTNKEIALSKDPEGKTYENALKAVGSNKYFTEDAPAVWYLPAFISEKYPYMDNNSKVTIYYNNYENLPSYLKDFNGIKSYSLSSADYELAWGGSITANYLSPKSISKIPSILKAANPDAKDGDMLLINYAYSETEPSLGGSGSGTTPDEPTWTQLTTIPVRSAGQDQNFVNIGPVDLSAYKGQSINIGFKYTSTTQNGAKWELKNFKALSVPYLDVYLFTKQKDGSFKKIETSKEFTGAGEYIIAALGLDNKYYPFGRLTDDSYTYGYMYPNPITVTQGTISANDAAYSIITVEATENGFTLKNAIGQYLYMSGTYDSFNVTTTAGTEGFDWTIQSTGGSDLFTIKNVAKGKSVKLNYYVNKEGVASYSYGSYSSDKINGYTYAENSLLGNNGGFTIYDVNTGGLDYVWTNDKTYGWIANGYVNDSHHETESYLVSPNIEIAENAVLPYFTIDEAFRFGSAEDITIWVSTNYQSNSTALAMTRASVTPNTAAIYRYTNNSWSKYSTDAADIAVVQPSDYNQMGYSYISKPAETLPIYLQRTYPYAKADDIIAVVYNSDSDGSIAATEFKYDGSTWIETTVATPSTITFQKADGNWVEARVYLESTLLNGESGGFTTQDIELSGLSYIWKLDNSYGWKGSGYYNNTNTATESYLISPEIDLSKAAAPTLIFDIMINFLAGNDRKDYLNAMISTDYSNDATTATWETLDIKGWPKGSSWDFSTIEPVSLKEYVGKKIRLAFHYKSTTTAAPTVEIKNISIKE